MGYLAKAGDRRSIPCELGSSCVRKGSTMWVCTANSQLPKGVTADSPLQKHPAAGVQGSGSPTSLLLGPFMLCSENQQCASGRCHFPGRVNPDHNKWCAECGSDGHCGPSRYCSSPAYGVPVCFSYGPSCSKDTDCSAWVVRYANKTHASGYPVCDKRKQGPSRCRFVTP
jgi:hypothetical protein